MNETRLDADGQPLNRTFNTARLNDRAIDELIGICRGVLADGEVVANEARFLQQWMENNRHVIDQWPANVLFPRIQEMLQDGVLDLEEQGELLDVLHDITGGNRSEPDTGTSASTCLPFCNPLPEIVFDGKVFCLTGKFVTGPRKQCEAVVESLGGKAWPRITKELDYLVVGEIGSTDWIHSTHGRKIEKGVELRGQGCGLCICPEEHWYRAASTLLQRLRA